MASITGKAAIPILKAVKGTGTLAYGKMTPGHVHSKLPFRYECKAGRAYIWCACGWSRTQPFCDGTHKLMKFKITQRPLRFECTETKEHWFCQCKHTKTPPFCDGTHNTELVLKQTPTYTNLVDPKESVEG